MGSALAGAQDPGRRLLLAAVHLRTADLGRALREGANPNATREDGCNALLALGRGLVVRRDDDFVFVRPHLLREALKCVETLLAAGTRIDAKSHDGSTLLHNPFVMRLLPDWVGKWLQDLDVHAANAEGIEPVHICAGFGLEQSARHLNAAGANWLRVTPDARTTLHFAAEYRNMPMALWLLAQGVPSSAKDQQGRSALLQILRSCPQHSLAEVAAALLKRGEPLAMPDCRKRLGCSDARGR